jgi:DNA-binding NarL/FixJ family response regulator
MMTRVLVADDFPLVREGLAAALGRHPDIEVVGLAVDGVDALEQAAEKKPDVVLMDLRMPRLSGMMALTRLRAESPEIGVLVMSAVETRQAVIDAAAAGASGYLSKKTDADVLCDAVMAVHRGEAVVSPHLTGHLLAGLRRDPELDGPSPTGTLTQRELNVLRLLAEGRTDAQISASLYVSKRTVQSHLAHIRSKTGLRRRTQLARWATEHSVT